MSRQVSPCTDKVYGLERVSRLWGVSRATIYRHRHHSKEAVRKRPRPQGVMADEGLVAAIQELLRDSPFHGEGYRKLWPGCALPASSSTSRACGRSGIGQAIDHLFR